MSGGFDPAKMEEIRTRISGLKGRYGKVGEHVDAHVDHTHFGKTDGGKGVGEATTRLHDAVKKQYEHARQLLDSVDRAVDASAQTVRNNEEHASRSFEIE